MPSNKHKNKTPHSDDLFELAAILSQQIDFQEVVRIITQKSVQLLNADIALVLMVNPQTQDTIKTLHKIGDSVIQPHLQRVQNQVSGWILYHNEPLLSYDIKRDDRFRNVYLQDVSITSVLGVPLRIEGSTIGSLIVFNKNSERIFSKDDLAFLEKIALIATPYLRNIDKLQQYFSVPLPENSIVAKYNKNNLIGKSESFVNMLQALEGAAKCDVKVLLEGETGTGKEVAARAIHNNSNRSKNPFVALDCGAIPEQLLESELFGHVKGSFTGATRDRKGLFQQANKGTLFLDEISNLPLDLQAKLLRVLQEQEIRPVGGDISTKTNVRIITAVSKPLQSLVKDGTFRDDLFFRLYVYPIPVPNLSERVSDIPLIAKHFIIKFSKEQNKNIESIHPEITSYMKTRSWPGNIRELENFVERLITLCNPENKIVIPQNLPLDLRKEFAEYKDSASARTICPLQESVADLERKILLRVLKENNWNQSEAGRILQISEGALRYKMKNLGIQKEAPPPRHPA